MHVYRITLKAYSLALVASGVEGRWNSAGRKVIYTAESIPLAFMENMVRRKGVGFNDHFRTMIIRIPDIVKITSVNHDDLKDGWRNFRDFSKCQPIGNEWFDKNKTAVLKVPSAVMPDAFNYVINTNHPDFKTIKLIKTIPLIPDERIEDILKKYPG